MGYLVLATCRIIPPLFGYLYAFLTQMLIRSWSDWFLAEMGLLQTELRQFQFYYSPCYMKHTPQHHLLSYLKVECAAQAALNLMYSTVERDYHPSEMRSLADRIPDSTWSFPSSIEHVESTHSFMVASK